MRKQKGTALILAAMAAFVSVGARANDGDFVWAKAMGGTGSEEGYGIAVDSSGNVYTTGPFEGTVDFDPGPDTFNLTSAGGTDIFVSKLDSAGNFVWAKAMGGGGNDEGHDLTVDSAGNVYTTGYFAGTADFDPGPGIFNLTGVFAEIFVSKLDSAGNFVWAKTMGCGMGDAGNGIAVDSAGNVYTTGWFDAAADFDPGPGAFILTPFPGLIDTTFISKLDSGGNFVWAKSLGGATNFTEGGMDITLDGASNVYTTGRFYDTVDFDPGPGVFTLTASSTGAMDVFVLKLNSAGSFVWAKSMGGAGNEYAWGIALDNAGNVYTTGSFEDTADFDPGSGIFNLTSMGDSDIFVSKLDSAGSFVWAKGLGNAGDDCGKGIALDRTGNVYTTGYFQGAVDFDSGPGTFNLNAGGTYDIFLLKLDNAGGFIWAKGLGGTVYDLLHGGRNAVDSASNVYTTGLFEGTADLDPGPGGFTLTSAGLTDIFVSKLSGPPDTTPPNVTDIAPTVTGPTSVTFAVTFDKPVQGFGDGADVVVNVTGSLVGGGVTIVGCGTSYTVTLTVISGVGTLSLAVNTDSNVKDLAGNSLATSVTSMPVSVDANAPKVPLVAWPLGLAMVFAGTVAAAGMRRK